MDGVLEHVWCRVCVVSSWKRRRRRLPVHLSEEEHEKRMFRIWCGFLPVFSYVVNSGMSLTSDHVVTQLQQEVFTLKAQVPDQSRLADAVRVINNRIWQRKRSSLPRDCCFKCLMFTETAHVTPRTVNGKKGPQSKSWSKSAGKGKVKRQTLETQESAHRQFLH